MDAFAKYYHRDKNPDQKHIPGVKLDHFTAAEWEELTPHLRASAEATGFYHDTAPEENAPAAPGTEGGTLPPAAINQVVQAAVQAAVKAVQAPPPAQPAAPPAVTPPPTPEKEPVSNG